MALLRTLSIEDDLLAELVADSRLHAPEALVLLPSRRACQRLKQLLLKYPGFVPTIMPLGQLDEIWLMQQAMRTGEATSLLAIPHAVDALTVQLALAEALKHQPFHSAILQYESYVQMAQAIWDVFEVLAREGKAPEDLLRLGHSELSEHWRERMEILRFAANWWQDYRHQHAIVSPTQRRNMLAEWLATHWKRQCPDSTVIIAGSTGSHHSTLTLMQAALTLPEGEVWLQGCDLEVIDSELAPSHPQAVFAELLTRLPNVQRIAAPVSSQANRLMQAFRHDQRVELPESVYCLDAKNEEDEARLAALLARETLADDSCTVAIITQDPQQVRRLRTAMHAEGIAVDSAVGEPALHLPALQSWQLIITAAADPRDPLLWLVLMQRLGMRELSHRIEREWLRGRQSMADMPSRLRRYQRQAELSSEEMTQLDTLLQAMEILVVNEGYGHAPEDIFAKHQTAFIKLQAAPDEQVAEWIAQLGRSLKGRAPIALSDYAQLVSHWLASLKTVRPGESGARVCLYNAIEARLMQADRVILCGLNEGCWPACPAESPWLHPALATQLGLTSPDAALGLSAYDFLTLSAMANEVFWLRAMRTGGTDQIPSRWLERFKSKAQPKHYLDWLHQRRSAFQPISMNPPAPSPPPSALPSRISLSGLEQWLRDPYGFYAKTILRLRKLDPLNRPADAALRGDILHRVMEAFVQAINEGAPLELQSYEMAAHAVLAREGQPMIQNQWAPRIMAMAEAMVALERARREISSSIEAEQTLAIELAGMTIEGRADRLEQRAEGGIAVVDYKTGTPPTLSEVKEGFAPQLPMLALMTGENCCELAYWHLRGTGEGVETKPLKLELSLLLDLYRTGIEQFIRRYQQPGAIYYAIPQPRRAPAYNDYLHLSRQEQWLTRESV